MVQSASVVVLPYDSTDQVTSGVLVDAIANGRPIVATAFPHAVELLGDGTGIVVPHDDPDALRSALHTVLTQPRLAGQMAARGASVGAHDGLAGGREGLSASGATTLCQEVGIGMTSDIPTPVFDQLLRMTDHRGTFEHACLDEPRPEHGYCTDDMARVLVVVSREPDASGEVNRLAGVALRFLSDAQALTGACRNRMNVAGKWMDEPSLDDCWGRCLWGLGTAVAHSDVVWVRKSALVQFERAAQVRSPSPRAMAYAALGAAEVLAAHPDHPAARKLITDYAISVPKPNGDPDWPWPEPRLTYANAVLAEAIIAAGVALEAPNLWQRGLDLLDWLLDLETRVITSRRRPSGDGARARPAPRSISSRSKFRRLADACARAAAVDPAARWIDGVRAAASWFTGANDTGQLMWDPETGGGFDGLQADGVNRNQGTESTLAVISTLQHAQRISLLQR